MEDREYDDRDTAPFQPHSLNSRRAAEHLEATGKLKSSRDIVYWFIATRGRMTDNELIARRAEYGIKSANTPRPRRRELELSGHVSHQGDRNGESLWGVTDKEYTPENSKAGKNKAPKPWDGMTDSRERGYTMLSHAVLKTFRRMPEEVVVLLNELNPRLNGPPPELSPDDLDEMGFNP